MRLLIYGGGFISRSLVQGLSQRFHITVITRFADFFRQSWPMVDALENLSSLDSTIKWDLVVFCSGPSTPASISDSASNRCSVELQRVLDVASQSSAFVYMSSGGALYAPTENLLTEESIVDPSSLYALMHTRNEKLVEKCVDIPSRICFRLGNPFGLFQDPNRSVGFVSQALMCAINETELKIVGDGLVVRDFFHVSSIAKVLSVIDFDSIRRFDIYNFGSGESASLLDVIRHIQGSTGRVIQQRKVPGGVVARPVVRLNVDKLHAHFPAIDIVGLQQGIDLAFQEIMSARKL